ncbi:MAG: helix-turn-helix domain-containing protein [Acidobacteriota bacterium]
MREIQRRNFFSPKAKGNADSPAAIQVPDLLSVGQLAKKLHLSSWSIYEMVKRSEIPHVRIGGKILFHPAKICVWIEARSFEARNADSVVIANHPAA